MNILQQILEGIIGGPAKGAEKPMALPMKPMAYMAQKKFVPTQNDPEYYAQNGFATNEAEAQAMVNGYRQQQSPGIKPLFPSTNFGDQPQFLTTSRQQITGPAIQDLLAMGGKASPYALSPKVQPRATPMVQPNFGGVIGSVNPVWQQQRGLTPYSPGEGPRTNFRR